jgi:hypothetical protein
MGKLLYANRCVELSKGNNKSLPSVEFVNLHCEHISLPCRLNAVRSTVGFSSAFTKIMFNLIPQT